MKEKEENPFQHPKVISKEMYDKIIKTAQRLFHEGSDDFEKISIKQICEEAEVSRVSFYKEFEDKNHLVFVLFLEKDKEYSKLMHKRMQERDENGKIPFEEIIAEMLHMMGASEFSDISLPLNRQLQKRIYNYYANCPKDNWRYEMFELATREGFFRKDIDINFALLLLKNLTSLYFDLGKAKRLTHGNATSLVVEAFFYGVCEYEKKEIK